MRVHWAGEAGAQCPAPAPVCRAGNQAQGALAWLVLLLEKLLGGGLRLVAGFTSARLVDAIFCFREGV